MRKTYHLLLIVLLSMTQFPLWAQSIRTYDVSSGLSSNSIKAIVQDDMGHIWFATTDGLNVFNGKEFRSYGCSYRAVGKDGISTLNIMTLLLHSDGKKIWAGTQSSYIYLFDPATETFKEVALINDTEGLPTPNLCYSIDYDRDGNLWIGTDHGLYIYNEENDCLNCLSSLNSNLPSNALHTVFCDSNGIIWIGSVKGLLKYNPAAGDFITVKTEKGSFHNGNGLHITTITEDRSGNLWVGTWNQGLAILDRNCDILRAVKPQGDNEFSSQMRVRSILPDTGEILWICTNYGLFRHDIIRNRLTLVELSPNHPNDNIYSSLKDREGGIWIGTFFSGLHYLSPRARQIECYTSHNSGDVLKGSAISAFYEDSDGLIYIASENGGLSLFDPEKKRIQPAEINAPANNLHALCIDGRNLYIGTYAQGIMISDLKTRKITYITQRKYPALPSNNIFSLYKVGNGCIYVGTDQGCAILDEGTCNLYNIGYLTGEFIYDIKEDKRGNLWFASYYNGIFKYDMKSREWVHYIHRADEPSSLPHNKTHSLYIDDSGVIWICTEGGGVCRYNPDDESFHSLKMKQGGKKISLSIASGISSDATGQLWISSNNGLWVCSKDGDVQKHLTYEDGLQSNQYSFGSVLRSSSGKIYFGGVNGFNVISPETLQKSNIRPVVTVRIAYDDREGNTVYSSTTLHSDEVTLPRNISSFTIDFECLSFTAPHKNEFAYIIEGQSDRTYTAESSVTFINFPYGKHSISVKAKNGDGLWSENEVILTINNLPPLLKSAGAKSIYILLAFTILVGGLVITVRKHDKMSRTKLNAFKAAKEEETYKAKLDFFTDVAGQEWFGNLMKIIIENIAEPEISIEKLAADLNMSRSSLQKKLKGLTGLSPVEFIRLIRLKKAAELLSNGNYRVSEVAYMVGFNKPSYFTSLFKKQYGVLPKEFKE